MKKYAGSYALTDSILQATRSAAKLQVFGDAARNVTYAHSLENAVKAQGHYIELEFSDYSTVMRGIVRVLAYEENRRLKALKEPTLNAQTRTAFITKWMTDKNDILQESMGSKEDNHRFLSGIMFATSHSVMTVPGLQDVIQADATHIHFGKYTLYSAYGSTADSSMFPIAFAYFFGNEDSEGWSKFWKFVLKIHPMLNSPEKTIVTDQNAECISAVEKYLPLTTHFHCSWHRKGNIMKNCGGGKQKYTGWWMFHNLVNCMNVEQLNRFRERNIAFLSNKAIA